MNRRILPCRSEACLARQPGPWFEGRAELDVNWARQTSPLCAISGCSTLARYLIGSQLADHRDPGGLWFVPETAVEADGITFRGERNGRRAEGGDMALQRLHQARAEATTLVTGVDAEFREAEAESGDPLMGVAEGEGDREAGDGVDRDQSGSARDGQQVGEPDPGQFVGPRFVPGWGGECGGEDGGAAVQVLRLKDDDLLRHVVCAFLGDGRDAVRIQAGSSLGFNRTCEYSRMNVDERES